MEDADCQCDASEMRDSQNFGMSLAMRLIVLILRHFSTELRQKPERRRCSFGKIKKKPIFQVTVVAQPSHLRGICAALVLPNSPFA
jgi:hypothetical protein